MGGETGISWTDATWNPWRGCTKVSPGCANCFMFTGQLRWGNDPSVVVRTSPAKWREPFAWNRRAKREGRRKLVFLGSWCDFFHQDADAWRDEAWDVIRSTPYLEYQILTKRPENIRGRLPEDWSIIDDDGGQYYYPNVWLGTSIENQHWADRRLPVLLNIPAKVHFASCEPLLGPINLDSALLGDYEDALDWVIVGGESAGPDYRYMRQEWADQLEEQCALADVAMWGKQRSGPVNELPLFFQGLEIKQFPPAWNPAIAVDATPAAIA